MFANKSLTSLRSLSILPILFLYTALFYSLHRLIFVVWNWSFFTHQPFSEVFYSFLHGLPFDFSVISILTIPVFLLEIIFIFWRQQKIKSAVLVFLYVILQIPMMILNIADSEYVSFTGRRFTYDSLFVFREVPGKFWQIVGVYQSLFIVGLMIIFSYVFIVYRVFRNQYGKHNQFQNQLGIAKVSIIIFAGFVLLAVLARGGLQKKPLGFAHAQLYALPMMNNLVLNSGFTFLQSSQRKPLYRSHFLSDHDQMKSLLNGSLSGVSLDIPKTSKKTWC